MFWVPFPSSQKNESFSPPLFLSPCASFFFYFFPSSFLVFSFSFSFIHSLLNLFSPVVLFLILIHSSNPPFSLFSLYWLLPSSFPFFQSHNHHNLHYCYQKECFLEKQKVSNELTQRRAWTCHLIFQQLVMHNSLSTSASGVFVNKMWYLNS